MTTTSSNNEVTIPADHLAADAGPIENELTADGTIPESELTTNSPIPESELTAAGGNHYCCIHCGAISGSFDLRGGFPHAATRTQPGEGRRVLPEAYKYDGDLYFHALEELPITTTPQISSEESISLSQNTDGLSSSSSDTTEEQFVDVIPVLSPSTSSDSTEAQYMDEEPFPRIWHGRNIDSMSEDEFHEIQSLTEPEFSLRLVRHEIKRKKGKRGRVVAFKKGSKEPGPLIPLWGDLGHGEDPAYKALREKAEASEVPCGPYSKDFYNDKAAARIFNLNNMCRHYTEIDFHHLRVREAKWIFRSYICILERMLGRVRPEYLTVIVGKGTRSPGKHAVLPSVVKQMCNDFGKRFRDLNGYIVVEMGTPENSFPAQIPSGISPVQTQRSGPPERSPRYRPPARKRAINENWRTGSLADT